MAKHPAMPLLFDPFECDHLEGVGGRDLSSEPLLLLDDQGSRLDLISFLAASRFARASAIDTSG
jgi:hypothetical protein